MVLLLVVLYIFFWHMSIIHCYTDFGHHHKQTNEQTKKLYSIDSQNYDASNCHQMNHGWKKKVWNDIEKRWYDLISHAHTNTNAIIYELYMYVSTYIYYFMHMQFFFLRNTFHTQKKCWFFDGFVEKFSTSKWRFGLHSIYVLLLYIY